MPDFALEREAGGLVAGVDEAGRGPLAGPVLAAAVVFHAGVPPALAALLDDSKKLTAARREAAFAALVEARARGEAEWAAGAASCVEIGLLNILGATHLAMRRAVRRLPRLPALVLIDGNRPPLLPVPSRCVVGGDGLSFSIAAASIIAKVIRNRAMARLCPRWPGYGFGIHYGYPTQAHREALARLGASPHHRRGFAPVEEALRLMTAS
jgi:ribonuclease HII